MNDPRNQNDGSLDGGDQSLEWLVQWLAAQQTATVTQQHTSTNTGSTSIPSMPQRQPDLLSLLQVLASQQHGVPAHANRQLADSHSSTSLPPQPHASLLTAIQAAQNTAYSSEPLAPPPLNQYAIDSTSQAGLIQLALSCLVGPPTQQIAPPVLLPPHPTSAETQQHHASASASAPDARMLQALSTIVAGRAALGGMQQQQQILPPTQQIAPTEVLPQYPTTAETQQQQQHASATASAPDALMLQALSSMIAGRSALGGMQQQQQIFPPTQQIAPAEVLRPHPTSATQQQHASAAAASAPDAIMLQALSNIVARSEALGGMQQQQSVSTQQSSDNDRSDSTVQEAYFAAMATPASQQQIFQPPPQLPLSSWLLPRPPDSADGSLVASLHDSTAHGNQGSLTAAGVQLPVVRQQRRKYLHESFPEKLYRMIQEAEGAGKQDIISFTSNGRAFRIHRPEKFCNEILPNYFRHKRFDSFKRQLSMYGFQKIPIGPDEGAFQHPMFVQGHPELCRHMKRVTELLEEKDDARGTMSVGLPLKLPPPSK